MANVTQAPPPLPTPAERPLLTPEECRAWVPISRSSMYAAIKSGDIPSIRLGRLVMVPTAALRRMLALDEDTSPDAPAA